MLGGFEEAHSYHAVLIIGLCLEKCSMGLTFFSLYSRRPVWDLYVGISAVREGPLGGV